MRILLLIDSLGPGGAQRQLVGLASCLREYAYDVTVVCYHDNCFYLDVLRENDVKYIYLKKAQNIFFRIWHIVWFIRKMKPDVVISYLETPSICACFAKLFYHHFKLIVSERNTTQHTGKKERIRFSLFKLADYVVPNAYSQEYYLRKTFPGLSNKIVTIPNFVDLKHFVPPSDRQRKDVPEIMIAATIWPSKNTLGLIDAVAALKRKGYRFHISWYGLTPVYMEYITQCENKIKREGVEKYIELKEKTKQIKECYQEADYFCLPSFYEGTPNVICEAMACGLPITCSNVCDNSRYVEEDVNGYLFDPKDVVSIAMAIERLLTLSISKYQVLCKRNRQKAEFLLSKDKFIKSYLELIK